jgi:hypothetical protein
VRIYPSKHSDCYDCYLSTNRHTQQTLYQFLYSEVFPSFKDFHKTGPLFDLDTLVGKPP